VPDAPLAEEAERAAVVGALEAFAREWEGLDALVGIEHREVADRTATDRWVLRFRGTEKDVIAVWLTLGQRTVVAESEVLPAPEQGAAQVHEYALARNASLLGLSYAIGPERGIYLMGRVPAAALDVAEVDRLCGAIVAEVDQSYPTLMTMAFPGQYRRRRRG
jgi:hypothetical protein